MPKVTMNIVFALALFVGLPGTLANSTTKIGNMPSTGLGHEIGRAEVKIHGTRDMSVWGGWFKFEADASVAGKGVTREVVPERINELVNYIETILVT